MRCASHCAHVALLLVLLLALALPFSAALRVTSTAVTPVVSSLDHQALEQLHIITHSDDPSETINSISSNGACQIYVSYIPSQSPGRLATVRVIGENAKLVRSRVAVSATDDQPGQLLVDGPSGSRMWAGTNGYLRVEIQVHSLKQLKQLQSRGSGDVVVEAPELFVNSPNAKLMIEVSGRGDVYLPPELPLVAKSLQILSRSSGSLYLPTSDLIVTDIQVTASGSGAVKIGASRQLIAASRISINSQGSGDCSLIITNFQAQLLDVRLTGSGSVTLDSLSSSSSGSSFGQCQYSVSGSGDLNAGGVSCSSAVVTSSSSGDITVQAKNSLVYDVTGSASVFYAGSTPLAIVSFTGKFKSSAVKRASDSPKQSKATWMDKYSLPPRESALADKSAGAISSIHIEDEDESDHDDDHDDDHGGENDSGTLTNAPDSTHTATAHRTRSWLPVLAIVLLVFLVWNRVEAWQRKKKRSGEQAPLLGSGAPVYI